MDLNIETVYTNGTNSEQSKVTQHEEDETSLGQVFYESLKKYSNNILQYIADTDETDTYGEVLTRSVRTALNLRDLGITENDIVTTCTFNHKNSIIPLIATLFLGGKSANLDPNLSYLDTVHLLKLIQPKIIFVDLKSLLFMEECLVKSDISSKLIVFDKTEKYTNFESYLEYRIGEENFKPVAIKGSKETAAILFSSGTTGLPKGICLSHYSLLKGHLRNSFLFGNEGKKPMIWLLYTTLYWLSAISNITNCIIRGHSKVVSAKFNAKETWKIIEKYKVTHAMLAPYHASDFLEDRVNVDTSSLEIFLTGSCLVTKKLMEGLKVALPHTKIYQVYGQTEAGSMTSTFDVNKPEEYEMQLKKPQSCGRILSGITWKVVDPSTEKILGPNERGELRLKSNSFMNGYYKVDSSSAYDEEGYLKTGDIVYYDEEECFYIVDRIKEMFKYRGWHILPSILEEILLNHPAVKEAVVVGIPHEIDGDHPMGIVTVYDKYKNTTPEEIEKFVEDGVPDIQRLRAGVKIAKEMLRTTTGKIKRNVMRQMILEHKI